MKKKLIIRHFLQSDPHHHFHNFRKESARGSPFISLDCFFQCEPSSFSKLSSLSWWWWWWPGWWWWWPGSPEEECKVVSSHIISLSSEKEQAVPGVGQEVKCKMEVAEIFPESYIHQNIDLFYDSNEAWPRQDEILQLDHTKKVCSKNCFYFWKFSQAAVKFAFYETLGSYPWWLWDYLPMSASVTWRASQCKILPLKI